MLWTFRKPGGGVPVNHPVPAAATHRRYWMDADNYRDAVEYTDVPQEHPQRQRRYGEGGPGRWIPKDEW